MGHAVNVGLRKPSLRAGCNAQSRHLDTIHSRKSSDLVFLANTSIEVDVLQLLLPQLLLPQRLLLILTILVGATHSPSQRPKQKPSAKSTQQENTINLDFCAV